MQWLLILLALAIVVYAIRATRVIESMTFYAPSRAAFGTPDGILDVDIPSSRDGTLHGWWIEAGRDTEHLGTVLFCHGNAGNLPDHLSFVRGLPEAGFNVLMFDYAGFGRSAPPRQVNRDSLLADAADAYRYLTDDRGIDPERVFLYGHSMGGVTAIRLAAREDVTAPAVAAVAPFTSFPRVAADHAGPIGWIVIDGRGSAEAAVTRLDPSERLLLIHGSADRIVQAYHSQRLAVAARDAGVDVQMHSIDSANHVDIFDPPHDASDDVIAHFASTAQNPSDR